MISEQAKSSFDYIFTESARSCLVLDPADPCSIKSTAPGADTGKSAAGTVLVITTSSFVFRLLTLLCVDDNAETRAYYGRGATAESSGDALFEAANLCCGTMNRELSRHFPHLGMSTPYPLSSRCLPHLQELRPEHVLSYEITIREAVRLHATLCLCGYAPIDFSVNRMAAAESATTGELELF